jgi:phenylacetic acid degradation operon negative regulatory protein
MQDGFLSTVRDAPVSYSVYSALSFFGRRQGGELPGLWFVRAFAVLGHTSGAVRQTLFRMERAGQLVSRRAGRTKFYRLAPWAQAEADAGLAKILAPMAERWDGRWSVLLVRFAGSEREHRENLYELLRSEGFASLGSGGFIHPHDRAGRILEAARAEGMPGRLVLVRGERQGHEPDADFVARHWNLSELEQGYRRFLERFSPILSRPPAGDRQTFIVRFAVVFSYLETAWRDPGLPPVLLPADWPGPQAQRLAARLYRRLLPGALRFAAGLLPATERTAS